MIILSKLTDELETCIKSLDLIGEEIRNNQMVIPAVYLVKQRLERVLSTLNKVKPLPRLLKKESDPDML